MARRRSSEAALFFTAVVVAACQADLSGPAGGNLGTSGGSAAAPVGPGAAGSFSAGGVPVAAGGRAGSSSGAGAPQTAGGGGTSGEPLVFSRPGLAARLSKVEYQHSIDDVLGVSLSPAELDSAAGGIPDDTGDGVFKHIADKQTSVEQHPLAYFQVAEAVAKRVDIPALAARLGACTNPTAACGTAVVQAVGRQLYRRPLEPREVDAMLSVFNAGLAEELDFADATRWTLMAMLQAPPFLFRLEHETTGVAGQPRDLEAYELAARLASFLWVSVPDDALLAAAADQSLLTPAVREAQLSRMLEDPKAQRFTEAFATDFSRARFASYDGATDADRAALSESVIATFQDHFWTQRGSVADLFKTTRFVVNPIVAQLLGLTVTGTGLQPMDVAGLPQRVGLMSHPGVIAGMGDRAVGSFVNRGKYLMERVLCRNPVAFPDDLATVIEDFNADTAGLNEHERAAIRMGRAQCWGCHRQFEPLAFGFSRFDGAGRYVGETDADSKPLPLDGWVPTGEPAEPRYTDVASYMQILATNPVVQTCMTEHFVSFATARSSDEVARVDAEQVGKQYLANGATLPAMVAAVVQSPLFRTILPQSAAPAAGAQP
jgi:hypothetical protein